MSRTLGERAWVAVGLLITTAALVTGVVYAAVDLWSLAALCFGSGLMSGFTTFVVIEDTR